MYTAVGNGILEMLALALCTIFTKRLFMDFISIMSLLNGEFIEIGYSSGQNRRKGSL